MKKKIYSNSKWDDIVLPFSLEKSDIRGRITRLDKSLNDVLGQHAYPNSVNTILAEALLLTSMIGQTIKLRWKLSLQIRSDGPISLIATDYFGPDKESGKARLRGYANYDRERIKNYDAVNFTKFGKGYFAILIDQGPNTKPYQGITPLSGASLAECARTYFMQSEQLPTTFKIIVSQTKLLGQAIRWRAAGIMLQHLPKNSSAKLENNNSFDSVLFGVNNPDDFQSEINEDHWSRVGILTDTVEEIELIGPHIEPLEVLKRLFHEEGIVVYSKKNIEFGCTCSRKKVVNAMSIYSAKEINTMMNEDGMVTADCQFCGSNYCFDPSELGFETK